MPHASQQVARRLDLRQTLLGGVLVLARLAMAAAALAHFAHALHAFMPMLAAVPGLLRFRLRRLGLLVVLRECRGP
jgi:hypothetical protein